MGNPGNHGHTGGWQTQPPYGQPDDEPATPFGHPPYGDAGGDTPRAGGSPYRPIDADPYDAASGTGAYPQVPDHHDHGAAHAGAASGHTDTWTPSLTAGETFSGFTPDETSAGSSGATPMFGPSVAGTDEVGSGTSTSLAPIGYERDRDYSSPKEPERRRKLPLPMVVSVVVVLCVLIGGGIAFSFRGGSQSAASRPQAPAGGTPTPTATPSPDPEALARNIRTRKADPKPLTLSEVFSKTRFTEGGGSYIMTRRKADKNCGDAVTGKNLKAALRKAKCTQLLRATFSTTGGKLVGTIGIANLVSEKAARAAARAARGGRNYVEPLRGSGNTRNLGRSGSSAVGTADVRGHYLILSWVQYPNGKKIAKKHYPAITRFERNVIVGCNLGTALGYRMINNRPPQN